MSESEAEDLPDRDPSDSEAGDSASSGDLDLDDVDYDEEFLNLLFAEYFGGSMSAEFFSKVCYCAARLQNPEKIKRWGKAPGDFSGNYQKFLDSRLGWKRNNTGF